MFGNNHKNIIPNSTYDIENFNEKLNKKKLDKPTFVWFYGEFCGHCHAMYDDWKELSDNKKITNNVNLLKIESSQTTLLSKDPEVFGYPTLRLYKISGSFIEYNGNRDANDMKLFVNKNTKKKIIKRKKSLKQKRSKKRKSRSQKNKSKK